MRRYTITVEDQTYTIDVQELGAERFRVLVGEQAFEVMLADDQDLAEAVISPQILPRAPQVAQAPRLVAPPTTPAPRPVAVAAAPPRLAARALGGGDERTLVTAPMPGLILALEVAPGERVSRGQVLLTLEAMKMQNAIKSPQDGVVAAVLVQPGQSVRHGDGLVQLEEALP